MITINATYSVGTQLELRTRGAGTGNHCIFFLYHFHTFLYTPFTLNPKP